MESIPLVRLPHFWELCLIYKSVHSAIEFMVGNLECFGFPFFTFFNHKKIKLQGYTKNDTMISEIVF